MRTYHLVTRKHPATDTHGETISVRTKDMAGGGGPSGKYPFPYELDAPEAHEQCARKALAGYTGENSTIPVTMHRTATSETGYTFRVIIGELPS